MRALALLLLLAVAPTGSTLVRASATFERLGDYWVPDDATYQSALRALGPSSSCRLVNRAPDWAIARWHALGVAMDLRTYGGLQPGQNGCNTPRAIHVSTIRITGRRWHTAYGLRVGASVARLHRLYPRAKPAGPVLDWNAAGFVLVSKFGCSGSDCPPHPGVPVLIAETFGGSVSALVLVVGAEGD
jgi:hypothetical protein